MWKCIGGIVLVGYLLFAAAWVVNSGVVRTNPDRLELLHVACDPTRELWADINAKFLALHLADTGQEVAIRMSHGGSSSQARAVVDNLAADFTSLALYGDTDMIRKAGLMDEHWLDRHPNHSLPYVSTMVLVVRQGNPKGIRDWADLARDDVQIITPNPKTSGNGKWSFLALYGSVTQAGGTTEEAEEFIRSVYRRVPVLDASARAATTTFAQKNLGDVHITWENEAHLEVQEAKGKLEIVTPSRSILAEPHIAYVDATVQKKGSRAVVEAYVKFLYTPEAQATMAKYHFRPTHPEVARATASQFPPMPLFTVRDLAPSWDEVQRRFFAEGAMFDRAFTCGVAR